MTNVSDIDYKDITSHNMSLFLAELQDAIFEGFTISPTNPGDAMGFYGAYYTVTMQRHKDDKPKLSRAEILANAREAKKAKTNNAAILDTESIVLDMSS